MPNEIITNLEITEDVDCCEHWKRIAHTFGWFSYTDYPEMAAMPHIRMEDGSATRINFCPVCGKNVRMVNMLKSRIEQGRP